VPVVHVGATLARTEAHVVGHRPGEEPRRLHHHADAPPQLARREGAVLHAGEVDGAAGRLVEPVEEAQERRLAGAARPDEGEDLAGRNRERHPVDEAPASDLAREALDAQDRRAGRRVGHPGPSRPARSAGFGDGGATLRRTFRST
jgi:hypothetical protein